MRLAGLCLVQVVSFDGPGLADRVAELIEMESSVERDPLTCGLG
jgi:hypothetical protein